MSRTRAKSIGLVSEFVREYFAEIKNHMNGTSRCNLIRDMHGKNSALSAEFVDHNSPVIGADLDSVTMLLKLMHCFNNLVIGFNNVAVESRFAPPL